MGVEPSLTNHQGIAQPRKSLPWEGGKCRVPMWCMGVPDGFCGKPAFGPQYPKRVLEHQRSYSDVPYCFGPCCPNHGGPRDGEAILFHDGTTRSGYPMWCAVWPNFENLQESVAGFDADPLLAIKELASKSVDGSTQINPNQPGGEKL